jgi:hypothetical protein
VSEEVVSQKKRWAGYRSGRLTQLATDLEIPEPSDFPPLGVTLRGELQATARKLAQIAEDYAANL